MCITVYIPRYFGQLYMCSMYHCYHCVNLLTPRCWTSFFFFFFKFEVLFKVDIKHTYNTSSNELLKSTIVQGRIQNFKLGGRGHLKNLRRAEGGANILGYFVWKITILRKKNHIFSYFRGARAGCAPHPGYALVVYNKTTHTIMHTNILNKNIH
jgi:hypothetical protein